MPKPHGCRLYSIWWRTGIRPAFHHRDSIHPPPAWPDWGRPGTDSAGPAGNRLCPPIPCLRSMVSVIRGIIILKLIEHSSVINLMIAFSDKILYIAVPPVIILRIYPEQTRRFAVQSLPMYQCLPWRYLPYWLWPPILSWGRTPIA